MIIPRKNQKFVIIEKLEKMGIPQELSAELRLVISIPGDITLCSTIHRCITEWGISGEQEEIVVDLLQRFCELHFR